MRLRSKKGAKLPSLNSPAHNLVCYSHSRAMSAANQQISRLRADLKRAKTGKATLYNNLGVLLRENGRPAEALRAHRRELTLGRQQNSMLDIALAHHFCGLCLTALDRPVCAVKEHKAAFEYSAAAPACKQSVIIQIRALNNLGLTCLECADAALQLEVDSENELSSSSSTTMAQWLSNPHAHDLSQSMQKLDDMMKSDHGSEHMRATCGELYTRQGMHYLFHALDLINESDDSIFDRGRFDKLIQLRDTYVNMSNVVLHSSINSTRAALLFLDSALRVQNQLKLDLDSSQPWVLDVAKKQRSKVETFLSALKSELTIKIGETHSTLGTVYQTRHDFSKALKHFSVDADAAKAENYAVDGGRSIYNIGVLYLNQSNLSEAKKYFKEAQRIATRTNNHDFADTVQEAIQNLSSSHESLAQSEKFKNELATIEIDWQNLTAGGKNELNKFSKLLSRKFEKLNALASAMLVECNQTFDAFCFAQRAFSLGSDVLACLATICEASSQNENICLDWALDLHRALLNWKHIKIQLPNQPQLSSELYSEWDLSLLQTSVCNMLTTHMKLPQSTLHELISIFKTAEKALLNSFTVMIDANSKMRSIERCVQLSGAYCALLQCKALYLHRRRLELDNASRPAQFMYLLLARESESLCDWRDGLLQQLYLSRLHQIETHFEQRIKKQTDVRANFSLKAVADLTWLVCWWCRDVLEKMVSWKSEVDADVVKSADIIYSSLLDAYCSDNEFDDNSKEFDSPLSSSSSWLSSTIFECLETLNSELRETRFVAVRVIDLLMQWSSLSVGTVESSSTHEIYLPSTTDRNLVSGDSFGSRTISASISSIDSIAGWLLKSWRVYEFDASQLSNWHVAITEPPPLNSLLELARFSKMIDETLPNCLTDDQICVGIIQHFRHFIFSLHGAPRLPTTEIEIAKFEVDDLDIANSDVDSDFAADQIDKVRASYRRHLQRSNAPKPVVSAPLKQTARSIVAPTSSTLRPIGDSDDEFVASSDDQSDSDHSVARQNRSSKSTERRSTKFNAEDQPQPKVALVAVPRSKKSIVESDDDEPPISTHQPRNRIVVESQDSESQAEFTNAAVQPMVRIETSTSVSSATSDRISDLNSASLKSAFRDLSRLLPASSGELTTSSQPRKTRISFNEQSALSAADLEYDDGHDDESENEASDADFVEEDELSGDDEEVSNHDLRHVYNDAIAYKDWKVAGDNANCLAHRYLSQGDVQNALKWFDRDLQASKQLMSQWTQSKRTTNGHILCSTHQYLGQCYRQMGDFEQAIKQHQEQKRLCNQCKDSPNFECFTELQRCEVELGEDHFRWAEHLGEEVEGLRKQIRAESDIEVKQTLRSKSESISSLINTHYEAALKHRKAALEMAERKGSLLLRARSHTNLGLVLAALNKCDDAIVEYNRALKCALEMTNKHPPAPDLPILDIESLMSEHFSEQHEMHYLKSLNDKQKHQREMSLVERSRAHCGLAAVYMDYLKPPVVSQALLHLQTDLALCIASRDHRGLVSTLNNLTRFCLLREVGPQHIAAAHFVNLALKHTVDVAASVKRVCDVNGAVDFVLSGNGDADAEMVDNRIRALRLQQELPDDLIVATQAESSSRNAPTSSAVAETVDTKLQLKTRFQKAKQLLAESEKLFMEAEYSDSDLLERAQLECESILKSISSDESILRRKTLEMYHSVLQLLLKLHQRPNSASGPAQVSQILKLKQLHRNAQNELDHLSEPSKSEAPMPTFAAQVSDIVSEDRVSEESIVRASSHGAKQSNARKSKSNNHNLPQLARRLNTRESGSPVPESHDRFIIADDEPSTDEEGANEQRHHEHDVGYFLQMNRKLQQEDERLREKRDQQSKSKQHQKSQPAHDKSSHSKPANIHDFFPSARQNSITISSSSDDESHLQSFDMDFEVPALPEQSTFDSFPTFNSIARTIKPSQRLENRSEQTTAAQRPASVKPVDKPSRFRRIDSVEFDTPSLKTPIPQLYRMFRPSTASEPVSVPATAPVDKPVDRSAISDEALLKTLPIQFQQKLKTQPQQPSTSNAQSNIASSTMVHVCIGKERVAVFVPPLVQVNNAAASHNLSGATVLTKARPPTVAWLMAEAANRYLQLTNRHCEIARMRFQSALVLPSDSLLNLVAGNSGTASVFEAELASQRNRTLHECYLACIKDIPDFQQHALLSERLLKFSAQSSTTLDLSSLQLRSIDLSPVLAALQIVSDLNNNAIFVHELNLANNFIDDECLVELVQILNAPGTSETEQNRLRTIVCRLQTLNLSSNIFTSKGLSHFLSCFPRLLSEGMSSFSLKSINLSGLLLGWDSLTHLQSTFQVCKNLEHLDLSYCSLDQDGQHSHNSLSDAIISLSASLKYLDLSGNRFISDVALNTLLRGILEVRYPQLVDIRLNSMCSSTTFKLSSLTLFDLLSASRVQTVELDDWNWQLNSLTSKNCHSSSFIQNISMRRSGSLPCQNLSALLNSFSGGNVRSLCLDGCQLSRQCWTALTQCVEQSNFVQKLSLQGIHCQNPMDEHVDSDLVIGLIEAACKTSRKFVVDLSGSRLHANVFVRLVSLVQNRSCSDSSTFSLGLSRCFAPGSLVLNLTDSHSEVDSAFQSNLHNIFQSGATADKELAICKALRQTWPRIQLTLSPNAGLESVLKITSV